MAERDAGMSSFSIDDLSVEGIRGECTTFEVSSKTCADLPNLDTNFEGFIGVSSPYSR